MSETVKVKIGVVVGSNGRAAGGSMDDIGVEYEWGYLESLIEGPTVSMRYIVNIELPVPSAKPTEIFATAEEVKR